MEATSSENKKKIAIKIKPESIKLDLFGDLMKFSKKTPREFVPLKKYDALAIHLVGFSRHERVLLYKFLCGLILTAHARRTSFPKIRKELFSLKNQLFLNIANNLDVRKVLNFRFCVSKRFKVMEYCKECEAKNIENNTPKRDWIFCNNCTVDRTYYNVLSMFHKFKSGGASLYLGKELITSVQFLKTVRHVSLDDLPEQLSFEGFRFTPHNLIAVDLESAMQTAKKLLALPLEKITQISESSLPPKPEGIKTFKPNPPSRSAVMRGYYSASAKTTSNKPAPRNN